MPLKKDPPELAHVRQVADQEVRAKTPVLATVKGRSPFGGSLLVRKADGTCVARGPISGGAVGDVVATSIHQVRTDGPTPALPDFGIAGLAKGPPEIEELDPSVIAAFYTENDPQPLLSTVARGRRLSRLGAFEFRGVEPSVSFNRFEVESIITSEETDEEATIEFRPKKLSPGDTVFPPVDDLSSIAYGNDGIERTAEQMWRTGQPEITSIDVIWGTTATFTINATGTGLSSIDTVEFEYPGGHPLGNEFIDSVVVTNATNTSLELLITRGDEFPGFKANVPFSEEDDLDLPWVHDPQPINFGTGGTQFQSDPLWVCHPPVLPIEGWLFFDRQHQSAGVTLNPGLYAAPMPFDPSVPGRVPIAGRVYEVPGGSLPIASVYTPSATAASNGYDGRVDAQWIGGVEGRMVISQLGDPLPNGGEAPPGSGSADYGPGAGVGWQVWDVLDDVLWPAVTFPSDNLFRGIVTDGQNFGGVVYQEGLGAQTAYRQFDGGSTTLGPRVNTGRPPHEALAVDWPSIWISTYPSTFTPNEIQKWNAQTGAKTVSAYTTIDNIQVNWDTENRGWPAQLDGGTSGTRIGARFSDGASLLINVSGTPTDSNNWPNISSSNTPPIDSSRGTMLGYPPENGTMFLSNVNGGKCIEVDEATTDSTLTIYTEIIMGDAVMCFPPGII